MRDLVSNIGDVLAIAPAVHSAGANGLAVDLLGVGRMAFLVTTGAIAGSGDFTVKVQHSDTSVSEDFADADPKWLLGTVPATLTASSAVKVGYIGHKRFVRLVLVKNGGTSIALGAVAALADLQHRPAA